MNKAHIWPVSIAAVLLLYIVFLLSTLLFANTIPVNLVNENYYQNAVQYEDHLQRVRQAAAAEHTFQLLHQPQEKVFILTFSDGSKHAQITGRIQFFRPSDAARDRFVNLQLNKAGQQIIDLEAFGKGFWRVRLDWQLQGASYFQEVTLVISE